MTAIRVLVVDDSPLIRKFVVEALRADPDLDVIKPAQSGLIALDRVREMSPDVILLDVEMPELNGIETIKCLRSQNYRSPIIMFSASTSEGAQTTLDALAAGASDFVHKPSRMRNIEEARAHVAAELIPKIKCLCTKGRPKKGDCPAPALPNAQTAATTGNEIQAIVIGISTGGPNALSELIPALPSDLNIPIFIVQHLPAEFTALLAQRLANKAQMPVVEGHDQLVVAPNTIYIAPGNYHMVLRSVRGSVTICTNQDPPENSCRPAADTLFRSAAAVYGKHTLGIVMTGMGCDGLSGSREIVECGGVIFAQDENSSVVWGMPGVVVKANLARHVLALGDLASAVTAAVRTNQ